MATGCCVGVTIVGGEVEIGGGVGVGVGDADFVAKQAAQLAFGVHGSFRSVPASISFMSLIPSLSVSRGVPPPPLPLRL